MASRRNISRTLGIHLANAKNKSEAKSFMGFTYGEQVNQCEIYAVYALLPCVNAVILQSSKESFFSSR